MILISLSQKILYAKIVHILAAIFNLAFVYTPLHDWQHGFTVVQYVSMPLLVLTGAMLAKMRKSSKKKV